MTSARQVDDFRGLLASRIHQYRAADAKVGQRVLTRQAGVTKQEIDHAAIIPRWLPAASAGPDQFRGRVKVAAIRVPEPRAEREAGGGAKGA